MVKRHHKSSDGKYHIGGEKFEVLVGSRAQVMHKTAYKTAGGLTRHKLKFNKHGRIVSSVKSATAKRNKRLEKAGYKPKKGKFVLMRKSMKKRGSKTAKKSKGKKHRRTHKRNNSGHCHNSKGRFSKC